MITSPIYSLPTEILARIFQESICHQGHDETRHPVRRFSSPVTLAGVCKSWRSTATGSPSLWAHLDIILDRTVQRSGYPPNDLWLRYLQGAPVQIHIRQHPFPLVVGTSAFDEPSTRLGESGDVDSISHSGQRPQLPVPYPIPELMAFLRPLVSHFNRLEIIASKDLQDLLSRVSSIIADLPKQSSQTKELKIIYSEECGLLQFKPLDPRQSSPVQAAESFFTSLTKLYLHSVKVDWKYLANLPNLVELRLEKPSVSSTWPISQDQLVRTLSSCPNIRSLMLFNIHITPCESPTPQTVLLSNLRVLSLRCMAWYQEMELTISVITPGPQPLHMSFELSEQYEPSCIAALRSFIQRSNVTILDIRAVVYNTWFATELGMLPNAHTLSLHTLHFSDKPASIHNDRGNPEPVDSLRMIWPQVRILHLVSCGIEKSHLRRILSMHDIKTLYLHRCFDDTLFEEVSEEGMMAFQDECRGFMEDCVPNIITLAPRAQDVTGEWLFVGNPM
ncbi:F-box-like domain protein [Ceratobasidium sp. AG-Ba]|nr:F-box-like domain protein [Ceratobasidium sp. AG-Ba]